MRLNLRHLAGALVLGISLAAATGANAGAAPSEVEVTLRGEIEIAPDGAMSALTWKEQAPVRQMIAQAVESDVRTWKFIPGTVNGEPAATRTYLTLRVLVTAREDGSMALKFGSARTGAGWVGVVVPNYPMPAAKRSVDAKLVAIVDFDEQGKGVIRSYDYDSSRGGTQMRDAFVAASKAAIADWKVEPERVAGKPLASSFRIPFIYCVNNPCSFSSKDAGAAGSNDKDPIALESAVRLLTPVEGRSVGGG